jgi:hypothetical protein
MMKKLGAEGSRKIVLVIEDATFEYTSGLSFSPTTMPLFETTVIAIVQTRRLTSVNENNVALTKAAKAFGITTNHRQIFVDAFVQGLRKKGIEAEVFAMPYESGVNRSSDREHLQPMRDNMKMAMSLPAFYLNFDAGTCSDTQAAACVRAFVSPMENVTVKNAIRIAYAEVLERVSVSGAGATTGRDASALRRFDAELSAKDASAAAALLAKLETSMPVFKQQSTRMFLGDR